MSKGKASDVLAVAIKEIGTVEQNGNKQKYGKAYGMDGVYWCMQFVWWCFQQVDKALFLDGGKSASCGAVMNWAKAHNRWVTKDYRAGDVLIYDFPNTDSKTDHTGICEKVEGAYVWAIEGNTSSGVAGSQNNGDGVYRKKRAKSLVIGAYRPDYAEEDEMTQEDFNKMMDAYLTELGKKAASSWATSSIADAKKAGITDGTRPKSFATREEVIVMLDRLMKKGNG